ncbi:MAG: hypothetical protein ACE15F_15075 [bacterium]
MFSLWTFPSWMDWILIFPLGLTAGILAGWVAGHGRVQWQWPVGYSRKLFHFVIFTLAGAMGLLGGFPQVQVFGAAVGAVVVYAVWRGPRSRLFLAVARPGDYPFEKLCIIMPLLMTALGGMVSNILFGPFAVVGYITAGWGDAAGEPVGTKWGRHTYRVPTFRGMGTHRSLEGSAAVFLASLSGCLVLFAVGFNVSIPFVFLTSLVLALITTLVEAVSFHSLDNLTIQIATSGACGLIFWMWGVG